MRHPIKGNEKELTEDRALILLEEKGGMKEKKEGKRQKKG